MKLESFKRLLGVPLEHIGKPSKLEKLVHENIRSIPGTNLINNLMVILYTKIFLFKDEFDSRTAWPNCPTIQQVFCKLITSEMTLINNYFYMKG